MKHQKPVTPRISVLLPCRNAAAFLHSCITSLETQTFRDFEVLAVDDASADDTAHILRIWAQQDPRVRLIHTSSNGLVNALNAGLEAARTEYIARMDADDLALPRRLERQMQAFAGDPELAACGTRVRYFPREIVKEGSLNYESWLNSLTEPWQINRDVFIECPIAHPTLMIKTDVLRSLGGYRDRGWPEDYDLVLRMFSARTRMRNVPEVLHDWRERPDRISRIESRYSEDAFRKCKVFYLSSTLIAEDAGVIIWGAGQVGKAFAREFIDQGLRVDAFVDVDEKKFGQAIHGARVHHWQELSKLRTNQLIVSAVSGKEPRDRIRAALADMGYRDGVDFVAVA